MKEETRGIVIHVHNDIFSKKGDCHFLNGYFREVCSLRVMDRSFPRGGSGTLSTSSRTALKKERPIN
jgi:hypothetical protein